MVKFRQSHAEHYLSFFSTIFFKILFALLVLLFSLFFSSEVSAQLLRAKKTDNNTMNTQNSKEEENKEGVKIPWRQLDVRATQLIRNVMDNKTIHRKMPEQIGYCDAELYDFMVQHPDVVVGIWELLGITQISLAETSPNHFFLREGTSTTSHIEILYKSKNLCIIYAKGEYETPMLPRTIRGESVLFLTSRFGKDKKGRSVVQSNLDAYIQIQNPGADMLARVLVTVVGKIADNNFEQTVEFVMNISESAENDYEAVQSVALKLSRVRREVAEELATLAETVYDRETNRHVADTRSLSPPKTLDEFSQHSSNSAIELPLESLSSKLPAESVFAEPLPKYAAHPEPIFDEIDTEDAKYQEEQLMRFVSDFAPPLSFEPTSPIKNFALRAESELPQINVQTNNEPPVQKYDTETASQKNRVIIGTISPTRSKTIQNQTSPTEVLPQSITSAPQTTLPLWSPNREQRVPRFNATPRFNPVLENLPQNFEQIPGSSDATQTLKTTSSTILPMPSAISSSSNPSSSSLAPPTTILSPTSPTLRTYSTKASENAISVPDFSAPLK
ncbi:MAG: hypothetical protein LBT05_00250 [Planctomycetaceae bacterium]|jgi:hypothetical protein|nr:hypothetical protein [Planctomycetaceae bacterium]